MRRDVLNIVRFIGVFVILYFVFSQMMVFMHVSMKGWEFILFTVVLAGIVEFVVLRARK
jgi:hypothetical protein